MKNPKLPELLHVRRSARAQGPAEFSLVRRNGRSESNGDPHLLFSPFTHHKNWVPHPSFARVGYTNLNSAGFSVPCSLFSCIKAWLVGRGFIHDCRKRRKMIAALAAEGCFYSAPQTTDANPGRPTVPSTVAAKTPSHRPIY